MEPFEYLQPHGSDNSKDDRVTLENLKFYNGARWKRNSRAFKAKHPLCERCKAKSPMVLRPSYIVHHIIPRSELPPARWYDWTNPDGSPALEAICLSCHTTHHNKARRQVR